jgi:hypothetical protein
MRRTVKTRARLFLPLLILSLLVDGGSASAANLAGSKCTKPGQIKTASKITYVCAKVGKSSVWIQAGNSGSSAKPSVTPSAKPTVANCTTGIGTKLATQLINDPNGLAKLQLRNPFNCTISYSISGQITCRHYKSAKTVLPAVGSGSLSPNQTAKLRPQQAFQVAHQSCQQLQKASGAGPEYGEGILSFNDDSSFRAFSYSASVISISN